MNRTAHRGASSHSGSITGRLGLVAAICIIIALMVSALFLPAALATNDLLATVRTDVMDVPPLGEADTPPQNSYVYASDGSELAELTFEENRVPVTLDEVPNIAINAVLATEDAEFYEHDGVNHAAIIRAAWTNISAGGIEGGASTITQQYVKMAFLSPEQTFARKVEEALYAVQLEREIDKDEILERYLNRSYFGNGVYGIGTAAERYFSTDVESLSLGEAATLAGLLRAPEANNPIASVENAEARRDIVLGQMATHDLVPRDEAEAAAAEPLAVDISEPPAPAHPFWSNWISRLLVNESIARSLDTQVDALVAMGETSEERRRTVFQSGLRIHTTIDPELQVYAEESLREHLATEDASPEEIAQAPMGALVSVEPGTGAIRTMALGPYEFGSCADDESWVGQLEDGQLLCDRTNVNPAVPGGAGSGRQPGSAFKPFVDAAALEEGVLPTLTMNATGPQDIPGCITEDGEPYTVRNISGDGVLNMYEAVAQSSNVWHVRLIADIGPDRAADMTERLSGYPVPTADQGCALALGATDTDPLAMATAYATLANDGEYCAPFPISHIEDATGNVVWEHEPECQQVVDEDIARQMVDILEGPVADGGTAASANLGEWPTRGKTGSTNDNRDAWFVGFVKQLSTAAWVGYPGFERNYASQEQAAAVCGATERPACESPRELLRDVEIAGQWHANVYGGTIPAPMWTTYMEQAVQDLEPEDFTDPRDLPDGPVPDVTGASSVDAAERIARDAGFQLDTTEVTDHRSSGTFVGQSPGAGGQTQLGTTITLQISNGQGTPPPEEDEDDEEDDDNGDNGDDDNGDDDNGDNGDDDNGDNGDDDNGDDNGDDDNGGDNGDNGDDDNGDNGDDNGDNGDNGDDDNGGNGDNGDDNGDNGDNGDGDNGDNGGDDNGDDDNGDGDNGDNGNDDNGDDNDD